MMQAITYVLALIGVAYLVGTVIGLLTLFVSLAAISRKRNKVIGKGMREAP